jgi:hypothetical protein
VTRRDQYIVIGLGFVALIAALWFLAIGPKRKELSKLSKDVEQSEQTASTAQAEAQEFAQARLEFPRAYTTMVRLGKAVPTDPDVPSLLVQLEHAAKDAGVDFRTVEVKAQEGEEGGSTPPPASGGAAASASASSGQASGGSGQAAGASGQASGGSGQASGAAGGGSATASASSGTTPQGGATGAPTAPAGSAPANATATATAPIGTKVGPAGFPLMQLDLKFQGSFFRMADFVHEVKVLVNKRNRRLEVSGRLISIDGIAFGEGKGGFPNVKANIAATTYLVPSAQGLLAGATPEGPAPTTPATPTPVANSGAPPTAVVSGP